MPFYLRAADIRPHVSGLRSALIVPCHFCPAASMAVREKTPYIELFRRFLRTGAYERFIAAVRRRLEDDGIRTAVFDSRLPHHYVACMWSAGRRRELAKRAAGFDGVVVLGCDATVETVREALGPVDCRIIQGMEIEGIMNILPTVRFPFDVSIEVQGITPVTTDRARGDGLPGESGNGHRSSPGTAARGTPRSRGEAAPVPAQASG